MTICRWTKCWKLVAAQAEMKHVIITDRNAPDALIEAADLVTEITMVKHPFRSGVKAQRGSNCDAARPIVRRWLLPAVRGLAALAPGYIGRAQCRERGCQYGE